MNTSTGIRRPEIYYTEAGAVLLGDNNDFSQKYPLNVSQLNAVTGALTDVWLKLITGVVGYNLNDYIWSLRLYPMNLTAYDQGNGIVSVWSPGDSEMEPTIHFGPYSPRFNTLEYFAQKEGDTIATDYIHLMTDVYHCDFTLGRKYIAPPYPKVNGKMDHKNYSVQYDLFLPYYGFVRLDTVSILEYTIEVTYIINFSAGTAQIVISRYPGDWENLSIDDRDSSLWEIYQTYQCEFGVPIPIRGDMYTPEMISKSLGLAKAALGAASVIKGASSPASNITSDKSASVATTISRTKEGNSDVFKPETNIKYPKGSEIKDPLTKPQFGIGIEEFLASSGSRSGGQVGGNGLSWFYAPQVAFLVLTKPKPDVPSNYSKLYGKPSNMSSDVVGTLEALRDTGFTTLTDFMLTGFERATTGELRELEALLKGGVIL